MKILLILLEHQKYQLIIGNKDQMKAFELIVPSFVLEIYKRSPEKSNQYWEASEYSKTLKRISTIFQWHSMPNSFKEQWVDYIEKEFNRIGNYRNIRNGVLLS